jgi:hypothetical protein
MDLEDCPPLFVGNETVRPSFEDFVLANESPKENFIEVPA